MAKQDCDQASRAQDLNQRWLEMTYGGALSFMRRKYTREMQGVDVAVSSIPYDCAVTYHPGCRLGPRAIRGLGDLNLIGMDVVEVAPAYDHAEITATAAATIDHDWLCLLAIKNGAKTNAVGRL